MKIGNFKIGQGKAFIIAELSGNHNQKFDLAVKTIREIKKSGADAVKIQTYTPDSLTLDVKNKYFLPIKDGLWKGMTLYEIYQKAYTPWDWQPKLKKVAEELGLILFSSPFDSKSVEFLSEMNVPAYKIASFEITDIGLIEKVAKKRKPVIISTGIATQKEIKEAVEACKKAGNNDIALLKCTSSYPASYKEINLKTIPDMKKKFKTAVGLSDHTMGSDVAIASVALGAEIIEKHFIIDRALGGMDAGFSMNAKEFTQMVKSIRNCEEALGHATYELSPKSEKSRELSRSLFVVEDVKYGEYFSVNNVRSIRPNFGLKPKYLPKVLGKKASRDIKKGTPLEFEMLS